jgi:hypothetical protein
MHLARVYFNSKVEKRGYLYHTCLERAQKVLKPYIIPIAGVADPPMPKNLQQSFQYLASKVPRPPESPALELLGLTSHAPAGPPPVLHHPIPSPQGAALAPAMGPPSLGIARVGTPGSQQVLANGATPTPTPVYMHPPVLQPVNFATSQGHPNASTVLAPASVQFPVSPMPSSNLAHPQGAAQLPVSSAPAPQGMLPVVQSGLQLPLSSPQLPQSIVQAHSSNPVYPAPLNNSQPVAALQPLGNQPQPLTVSQLMHNNVQSIQGNVQLPLQSPSQEQSNAEQSSAELEHNRTSTAGQSICVRELQNSVPGPQSGAPLPEGHCPPPQSNLQPAQGSDALERSEAGTMAPSDADVAAQQEQSLLVSSQSEMNPNPLAAAEISREVPPAVPEGATPMEVCSSAPPPPTPGPEGSLQSES